MKSNIKYVDILVIALGIAYFFIGIINIFGVISGKIILLCSIVSFAIAVVQIMDSVATYLRIIETNVIKSSVCFYRAWCLEHRLDSADAIRIKNEEYKEDWDRIHKKFDKKVNHICRGSNIGLTITMVFFIIGLSTDFIKGNTVFADTLTLFSFAIIFLSIAFQTSMDRYIENVNEEIDKILEVVGE